MKMDKLITDFIQLRIVGKSFDEIAKELNVAKTTLLDWNKKAEVRNSINEGKALSYNAVLKAFEYDRLTRVKTTIQLSKRINAELLSRDLTTIDTVKLLQMLIANENRILKFVESSVQIGENDNLFEWVKTDGFFKFDLDE